MIKDTAVWRKTSRRSVARRRKWIEEITE